jgi:hypothetical protein
MAGKGTKKVKKSLFVRCSQREKGFPSDLLGRINATAELLEMDRDEFVAELLRQDMEQMEPMQKEVRDWWKLRAKPKPNP